MALNLAFQKNISGHHHWNQLFISVYKPWSSLLRQLWL